MSRIPFAEEVLGGRPRSAARWESCYSRAVRCEVRRRRAQAVNRRLAPLLLGLFAATPVMAAGPDRNMTGNEGDEPEVRFTVVFFPPGAPVYGAPIADRAAETRLRISGGRALMPPGGLADFVGEIFYPPLSTRLYSGALSRRLEERIEEYRSRRNLLVGALLDKCVALHAAADEEREAELRAFAETQTPLIAALEADADALRADLTVGRFGFDLGWNAHRPWKIDSFPANREWMNLEAEFQVVRAAAFYDDGLTPAQRGLARELAFELDRRARKARGEPAGRGDSDALFFSPETARLRLPADLPPAAVERLAAYNREKAVLKDRLRETVRGLEKAPRPERAAAFARLADEQWPQFGTLETLAEQLRAELAPRFVPVAPEKPPAIPAWLIDVINEYNEDRDNYFGEMRERIRAALNGLPRPARSADADQRLRQEDEYAKRRQEVERKVVHAFQSEQADRFSALEKRYRAIRTALEEIARTTRHPRTGKPLSVETLLQQHASAMAEFEGFGRASAMYANYRTAMLQRGLSPEQRRLLFGYAIAGLAQPLPYGEPLPRRALKFPLPR